ncbi:hypothetical protein [Halalkalibacter urbisdiaboli]|uniref:hypothetical protein n=1 Tax=Halalkalibacter urbisdiaboli TaxID=1960589 RepID=UPI000B44EB90|nr:hypothetical protein [Halalkalibacter urbisdiaboli]
MRKWIPFLLFTFVSLVACHDSTLDEEQVLYHYDKFLQDARELFSHHVKDGDIYYNQKYHTQESIEQFLSNYMTETGVKALINELFVAKEGKLIYKEQFQHYLQDRRPIGSEYREDYYHIVRESVLNPGLRFVDGDEVDIHEENGLILIEGEQIPIYFYDETSMYAKEQFGRFGYPSFDQLSISVSLVKDGSDYLVEQFTVKSS